MREATIIKLILAIALFAAGGVQAQLSPLSARGGTLFASAARTVTVASADQRNEIGNCAHLVVDITAISGTGPSLTTTVQGRDPASGKYYTVLASAALSAVATTTLKICPGNAAIANVSVSDFLPQIWRVNAVIAGTTPSVTFSVGFRLSE